MISARVAAGVFCGLAAIVAAFQLALALGAPWGAYAMGGRFPGTYPPAMRVAAIVQMLQLVLMALAVLIRAGLILPAWRPRWGWLAWPVTLVLAVGVVLNLITPSPPERLIWTPVATLMFLASLRIALAR